MSELINNSRQRMDLLKHLILEIHHGCAPEQVQAQLARMLVSVPYGEVMQVEQELIHEGLPQEDVLRFCDQHTAALKGQIDVSQAKTAPEGHPVHVWLEENAALNRVLTALQETFDTVEAASADRDSQQLLLEIRKRFNELMDVDKHYRRKEYLLFPYMEKHGITGPPKVMWGKHDQTRALLKTSQQALAQAAEGIGSEELTALVEFVFKPAASSIAEMIFKEEQILFPMCLDTLTDEEWFEIAEQSPEIGFCLYDPKVTWAPDGVAAPNPANIHDGRIVMDTGSFSFAELEGLFKALPVDLTFVDANDRVKYFSHGEERIFDRNRAILGREVQFCHPPQSVHIVNKILSDFRSGVQSKAEFWITLRGKFVHISYYAVRGRAGDYLGTLEVTMDLTRLRALEGERRLLTYESEEVHTHA
jgi:hypothetical protein